ncbi:MAG: hypothetical protein KAT58_05315 [candidate division Zixibacteria bacterium]|nr:hypothetical protein [candidate division Zixibacteria bacterium]
MAKKNQPEVDLLMAHDRLYRLACRKFLDNDLTGARKEAGQAMKRARQFYEMWISPSKSMRFCCRAQILLKTIDAATLAADP